MTVDLTLEDRELIIEAVHRMPAFTEAKRAHVEKVMALMRHPHVWAMFPRGTYCRRCGRKAGCGGPCPSSDIGVKA